MRSMQAQATNDNVQWTKKEQELFALFAQVLEEREGPKASFAETEAAGMQLGNDLCLQHQKMELERRAARWTSEELLINGKLYGYHEEGSELISGLCGSFRVRRPTYREEGVRNGPIVVPLNVDAGLLWGATPALGFKLCEGYAQAPGRQVRQALVSSYRRPPSRSTMERISKKLGGEIGQAVVRLEPVVRAQERLPEGTHGLALGFDRTSAPMEEPLDEEALAKHRNPRTKPYVRSVPDPIEVKYRMAYVGTVSAVDVDGRALRTWRYGASAAKGPEAIVERMMADVTSALSRRPNLPIGLVQDGAPEMWNLMRGGLLKHAGCDVSWLESIDRHHLLERLSDVLLVVKMPAECRKKQLSEWNRHLDADDNAIDDIERHVVELRDESDDKVREVLDGQLTYLNNNKHRMRYASVRAAGLPVGSGPTEGACKSLVMVRAKACGQRWHAAGLDAVLTLRGLHMSERLAPVFDLFAREKVGSLRMVA